MTVKKRNYLELFLDYFMAIMIVLNCQSVYQNALSKNYYIFELTLLSIVLCTAYKFYKYGISINNLKITIAVSFFYLLLCSAFILISVPPDQFISFGSRYFVFPLIMVYFFSQKNNENRRKFFINLINVTVIVAFISLFFWFFGTFLHVIQPTGKFEYEWGLSEVCASYYDIYFEIQWVDWFGYGSDMKRNTGMFVEGPCYAVLLMITLLCMYVFRKDVKRFRLKFAIICITIITTFSITAYAFLMAILFFMLRKNRKIRYILYFGGIPIALAAMIFVFYKKTSTGSFELRSGDTQIIIDAWLLSPLYGNGYGDAKKAAALVSDRKNLSVASSLGSMLMQGGIMYISLYMIPIIKGIFDGINKKVFNVILISLSYFAFLLVVLFQTFYINFFIWFLLLFYSYFEYSNAEIFKHKIMEYIRKEKT